MTRSSALSLQAKLGLPRGNQILGFIVLSKYPWFLQNAFVLMIKSTAFNHAIPPSTPAKQSLSSSVDGYIPDIFANVCSPHHLVRRSLLPRVLRYADNLGSSGASHLRLQQRPNSSHCKWKRSSASITCFITFPITHTV